MLNGRETSRLIAGDNRTTYFFHRDLPKNVPLSLQYAPLVNMPILDLVRKTGSRKSAPGFRGPDTGKTQPPVVQGFPTPRHGAAILAVPGECIELPFRGEKARAFLPKPGF